MSDSRVVTTLYRTLANLPEEERRKIYLVSQQIADGRELARQRWAFNQERAEVFVEELRHNLAELEEAVTLKGCRTKYFHFYTPFVVADNGKKTRKLGVTTCLIIGDSNDLISRGVAIVSPTENPRKDEGRLRALRRAFDSADSGETDEPVFREKARSAISACIDGFRADQPEWLWKRFYMPSTAELSAAEQAWYINMIAKPRVQQVQTA